jgi:hypothetical protein
VYPWVGFFRISAPQHTRVFAFFVHLATINKHHVRHASLKLYDLMSESDTEFFLDGAKPV